MATEQIPLKANFKHGQYRRLSQKTFNKELYNKRSQAEGIYGALKRKTIKISKKQKHTTKKNKENKTQKC